MGAKYRYEFQCFGKSLFMAVGDTFTDPADGDTVKVKRFRKATEIMNHLVIQVNKSPEIVLEAGQRIVGGQIRADFKRVGLHTPNA